MFDNNPRKCPSPSAAQVIKATMSIKCQMLLKPTQPSYPPPMVRRHAIRNTSPPSLKPRPPTNPPPMGHYVCHFLAHSGDKHGDDNNKSKSDYDYGDACEKTDNASGDALEAPLRPKPPTSAPPMAMMQAIRNTSQASLKPGPSMWPSLMGQHVYKFRAQRGDERDDDNAQSKDDYDYVHRCERMAYTSGDGCEPPLKPTPPTNPPSMAMRQAIWNTSQPSFKPRPSMCPRPTGMRRDVWTFFAKSGDKHGNDNDQSTNQYDYGDACERMENASGDAWKAPLKPTPPTPPAPPIRNTFSAKRERGDEHGHDNHKSKDDNDYAGSCDRTNFVARAQDDDGSAKRQYGNENFKDDKSKVKRRYADGPGSGHDCEAKDFVCKSLRRNSFETTYYDLQRQDFQRHDDYVKKAKASKKSYGTDQSIGRKFKITDEGALYEGDLREHQLVTGTATKKQQHPTGTLITASTGPRQWKVAWTCT